MHNVVFVCNYGCEKVTELIIFWFSCYVYACSMMGKYANVFMSILEANKMKNININFSLFVYRCVQDLFNHKFQIYKFIIFQNKWCHSSKYLSLDISSKFHTLPHSSSPPPQPLSLSLTYISFLSIACKKHSSFFRVIHQLSSLTLHPKSKLLMPWHVHIFGLTGYADERLDVTQTILCQYPPLNC